MLPSFEPMRLTHLRQPFDHKDWLFELKYDGFRALAYVENGSARVVSRRHNAYKTFNTLCAQIAQCLRVQNAILDGEIVCLGKDGRPQFHDLLRRRSPQYFYAFDLLWLNDCVWRIAVTECEVELAISIEIRNYRKGGRATSREVQPAQRDGARWVGDLKEGEIGNASARPGTRHRYRSCACRRYVGRCDVCLQLGIANEGCDPRTSVPAHH